MLSKPIMNPLTKLTLITCSQTKHTQNSVSESAHRRTRVRQSFWAKMATFDLNHSACRTMWEEGGRSLLAKPTPGQLLQQ